MSQTTEFGLGQTVRDEISGFEGIVTRIGDHISGCKRIEVSPTNVAHDDAGETAWFYEAQLKLVDDSTQFSDDVITPFGESEFEVGQLVRDELTEFEGVASVINYPLFNCPRVLVQNPEDPDESHWFDTVRLEAMSEGPEIEFEDVLNADEHTQSTGACAQDAPSTDRLSSNR